MDSEGISSVSKQGKFKKVDFLDNGEGRSLG